MAETLDALLQTLDGDRDRAGERYEELRRKLIRFFEWRGAPYPEECADETLDRVSKRLSTGTTIANIGAYCYEVARLVALEARKSPDGQHSVLTADLLQVPGDPVDPDADRRMACLEACLEHLPRESRELILEYYRQDTGSRIDARRALAERLGVQRDALANRAQRVRNKLEECVARCMLRRTI